MSQVKRFMPSFSPRAPAEPGILLHRLPLQRAVAAVRLPVGRPVNVRIVPFESRNSIVSLSAAAFRK